MMYKAFMSYSHSPDDKLAATLQTGLKRFAKPWYKVRGIGVFRDKTSLSPTSKLWSSIEKALNESEFFILIASPESATSTWVHQEIETWLKNNSIEKFLIVLTDGKLNWNNSKDDFDWDTTTAIPNILRGKFIEEPLYADLRWIKAMENISLNNPRLKEDIANIAATLHGKPKDDLIGEDIRQQKRVRTLAWTAAILLLVLTIATTITAFIAIGQKNVAQNRLVVSRSRELAAQSVNQAAFGRIDLAMLLGREAYIKHRTLQSRNALLTSLTKSPHLMGFLHDHKDEIVKVTISEDGSKLASCSIDGEIFIWDINSRKQIGNPKLNIYAIGDIVFHPDGRTLIIAGCGGVSNSNNCSNGVIYFWDIEKKNMENPPLYAHNNFISCLAINKNGNEMASGDINGKIILWDLTTKQSIGDVIAFQNTRVTDIAFKPFTNILASAGRGEIKFWDIKQKKEIGELLKGHYDWIRCISFSQFGNRLVSGGQDGQIILWDVKARQHIGKPYKGHTNAITSISWIEDFDGDAVVSGSYDQTLIIWDFERETLTLKKRGEPLIGHTDKVMTIDVNNENHLIVSGDKASNLILWDFQPRALAQMIQGPILPAWDLDISKDGKVLATGGDDDAVSLWNLETLQRIGEPLQGHDGDVNSVIFCNNDSMLISGSDDGSIIFWDVFTQQKVRRLLVEKHNSIRCLEFDTNTSILASGCDNGGVVFWNMNSPNKIGQSLAVNPELPVICIAFSPVDSILVAPEGGGIVIWDLSSKKPYLLQKHRANVMVTSVAFSPDGKMLASGDTDGKITLWDMKNRKQLMSPFSYHTDCVNCIDFSSDGRIMASCSDDKSIILFDMETLQPFPQRLKNYVQAETRSLVFSPNNRTLISVSWDQMILLWDIDDNSWFRKSGLTANRNLTYGESILFQDSLRLTCNNLSIHSSFSDEVCNLARAGELEGALALLKKCSEIDPKFVEPPNVLNAICWSGCLYGKANKVIQYCNAAVQLADSFSFGIYCDSRGLARALIGDYDGAIEDFNTFLEWSNDFQQYKQLREKRISWINSMKSGENPFDEKTLEELRRE